MHVKSVILSTETLVSIRDLFLKYTKQIIKNRSTKRIHFHTFSRVILKNVRIAFVDRVVGKSLSVAAVAYASGFKSFFRDDALTFQFQ